MKACATAALVSSLALATFIACGSQQSEGPPPQSATEPAAETEFESTATEPVDEPPPADDEAFDQAPEGGDEQQDQSGGQPAGRHPDEARTTDDIANIVKINREPARACYEKALKDKPNLKGDLVIRFVLDPNGKVKSAELNKDRSTITEPSVVSCVIDVIRGLKFPESSRGMETKVNYPFNFNP